MSRSSTVTHEYAKVLAPADEYDQDQLESAFRAIGLIVDEVLICAYCSRAAATVDHLNPLVIDKKFSGWGHVFGNLVPACKNCNESKGGKPWREFAESRGVPKSRIQNIATYESQAPVPVSQDELAKLYPDLIAAYEHMRKINLDALVTAQHLANELHRLEKQRRSLGLLEENRCRGDAKAPRHEVGRV